jgi:HSP20 family molecular chaperone IbpA
MAINAFDELFYLVEKQLNNKLENFEVSENYRETNDEYLFKYLVPGFNDKNLSVLIEDGRIHIKGEREDKFSNYKVEKSFPTPKYVVIEKTKAEILDGILMISFPKKEIKNKSIKLI